MRCQSRGRPCRHRSTPCPCACRDRCHPIFAVECEPSDGQRLTLGTGLFHPIVDATRDVPTVAVLGNDALKASLAGVLVHLGTIDLKALAELDIGLGDDLVEQRLTLEQRHLPQVVAIEVKQIECDHHFFDRPLSSFCNTEKSVVPSTAGTTTSPSMIADPALMLQASAAIFRKRLVQSLPRRVNTLTAASLR